MWGMMSSAGVGPIVRFHSNINANVYKELLCPNVLPHLHKGTVETPIFMQDNAPCHKAKTVLSFLEEEGIAVMKWPPKSPDINPIENKWKIIGKLRTEILKILMIYGVFNWAIDLMSRVFANGPGDWVSIPGRVIPKTQKMVLDAALLSTQYYKVRIKGKVEQSRKRSSALLTPRCLQVTLN